MADIIDDANERAEMYLRESLAYRRTTPVAAPTGACLHCEEPVAEGVRWCSTDCRDDWQAMNPVRDMPPAHRAIALRALPLPGAK